ncbi:MAG: SDR family NAD(P)-dependent oxidoreductase [Alcanivoracaceae bacterium]|nr:SDR family NAD(P)-dependent oxidoreductase [Alcanivoracaceae bacterium]
MRLPETILVVGGSGGIGSALCNRLHDDGHTVIATSRRPAVQGKAGAAYQVALDLQSSHLRADINGILDRFPEISTVIHCAGQNRLAGSADLSDAALDQMLTVNLRSAMTVGAIVGERFKARGHGTLVYIGSMLGHIGVPGYSAYCASKFGLRGYAEALRRELHHHGIEVLTVSPRTTRTAMNSETAIQLNEQLGNHADTAEYVAGRIVSAWEKSRARSPIGWPERLFAWLNSNFPFLVDKALSRQASTVESHLISGESH